jgi:HAD superfamily phosphatase (TIGR01668 family)
VNFYVHIVNLLTSPSKGICYYGKMPSIFTPHYRAHHITDITPEFLQSIGIKAAMLDLDGNLVGYKHGEASQEVVKWISAIQASGIRLCIVSNPGPKSTLDPVALQLGIKSFKGKIPKPHPKAFKEARLYLETEYPHIAMIGDQLLTDMVGANALNMATIWVDTIPGAKEGWITRNINRRLERVYNKKILHENSPASPYLPSANI